MQQYFVEEALYEGACILMDEEAVHHISHVLRMKENDQVYLANGESIWLGSVHFDHGNVMVKLLEEKADSSLASVKITLGIAMIKKDKWDFLLMKTAELGVSEIVPFFSRRCVVKAKEEKGDKKLMRYRKILQEACEQCKRSSLVKIENPCTLEESLSKMQGDLKLIAYESADVKSCHIKDVLNQHPDVRHVCVVIGCEGGFEEAEVQRFEQAGFIRVSLGGRILRAETAAMAAVNLIDYHYH